ncbi:MAG: GNAT family N-acetyltransferase [archaeon]
MKHLDTNKIKIRTEHLILEPISMKFKEDIFSEFTKEITTYMYPQPPKDIKETEKFILDSIRENHERKNMQMVILKKGSGEFLGCTGLHKVNTRNPELGIWIKKSAHGNKYGLETISALKKWADKELNYDYLYYPVAKENIASRKIPEILGGKLIKEFVGKNIKGKKMEEVEYRIYKKSNTSK